jgi:hypothetical protein
MLDKRIKNMKVKIFLAFPFPRFLLAEINQNGNE